MSDQPKSRPDFALSGSLCAINTPFFPADQPDDLAVVVTAAITREAAEELALAKGTRVTVLIKATEVMLAIE
jgi:hypothetical protein